MFKKILAATGVAGLLVLGASSAAMADEEYVATLNVTAQDPTLTPGQATTVTVTDAAPGDVLFGTDGPGVESDTLTSISFAADSGGVSAVTKVAGEDGVASATFTAPNVSSGTYVVTVTDSTGEFGQVTLTVGTATAPGAGSGSGTGTGGSLPATGGNAVPAAAVWLGAGAVGLGGIAITAAVARRRAAAKAE